MRNGFLARVVIGSIGISVVTLGCDKSPGGPSPVPQFSVRSISPSRGSNAGGTVAIIEGDRFQTGDTVTVGASRVEATVLSPTSISLTMPAHAPGQVRVTVSRGGTAGVQSSTAVWFQYYGPPVIKEVRPNIGATGGGTPIAIFGEWWTVSTVTVGGIVTPFEFDDFPGGLYLSTPAHAAGTVEVSVTDRHGQVGSGVFTYASPDTFDFNGVWQGVAEGTGPSWPALFELTIRDNVAVSASCTVCRFGNCEFGNAPNLTLEPPLVVANGEFSFAGSGGVSITGKILSPNYASGSIDVPSCVSKGRWSAQKK